MRYIVALCILFGGCQYFQPKEEVDAPTIAQVGDKKLLKSTLDQLTPADEDSASFAEKFVMEWVKKQLMIQKAEDAIDFDEAKIQNKVLDYQYALMVHELEQSYIEAHLDEHVSEEEAKNYYAKKSENFILRQNLAKCLYFKMPKQAPDLWRFRRNLKNYPKDSTQLWAYTNEHAVKAFLEDTIWVKFDEVLQETPFKDVSDKATFLKRNSYIEAREDEYVYFLKILEYRLTGEVAPFEFIRDNIKDIIINKRKISLVKELEKNIYEEAESTDAFEIFSH